MVLVAVNVSTDEPQATILPYPYERVGQSVVTNVSRYLSDTRLILILGDQPLTLFLRRRRGLQSTL